MITRFRPRAARTLAIAALLAMSAVAGAREVRMQGPNGESGTCPEAVGEDDAPAPAASHAKRAGTRDKARAAPMVRSSGDSVARPRWHSILPGMIR